MNQRANVKSSAFSNGWKGLSTRCLDSSANVLRGVPGMGWPAWGIRRRIKARFVVESSGCSVIVPVSSVSLGVVTVDVSGEVIGRGV